MARGAVGVRALLRRGGENSTPTDDNGAFVLRRLTAGTYTVTVGGGREFETATETVDIFDGPRKDRPAGAGLVL